MKALVLTGGGARGAYEAGVVKGLSDRGNEFDLVCGTSIGAINAAFVAQDELPNLEELWKSIAARNVIDLSAEAKDIETFVEGLKDFLTLPKFVWPFHIRGVLRLYHAMGPIGNLSTLMSALDRQNITEVIRPTLNVDNVNHSLIVSATNVTLQTSEAFGVFVGPEPEGSAVNARQSRFLSDVPGAKLLTAENFLSAVEASAAIPFAFPAVDMNLGTANTFQYVDGGVANNTPIGLAIAAGATDITVVFMDPLSIAAAPQNISNAADLAMACYSVMQQKILSDDMKLALLTNKAIAAGPVANTMQSGLDGKLQVALHEVRPKAALGLSVLGFDDQAALNAAFDQGFQDAANVRTLWP